MGFNRANFCSCTVFFFNFNVESVVKSAFMRYCDVVSWYVAIPGVIYQCAPLSLFSWFEFKIKQAVTCAEFVCPSHLTLALFSSRTVPNAAPEQWKCDSFLYSTPCYSDVLTPTHILSYLCSAVNVWNFTELWKADLWAAMMSTCDWQQKSTRKIPVSVMATGWFINGVLCVWQISPLFLYAGTNNSVLSDWHE